MSSLSLYERFLLSPLGNSTKDTTPTQKVGTKSRYKANAQSKSPLHKRKDKKPKHKAKRVVTILSDHKDHKPRNLTIQNSKG